MRFFFIVLFLQLSFFAFPQKVLLEIINKNNKTVQYVRYPSDEQKASNYFLEQISEKSDFYHTTYQFDFTEAVKLFSENNKLVLSYRLSDFVFRGSNKFKNIDISKLLLPSQVFLMIGLYDQNNKELLSLKLDTCCLTNPGDIHEWLIPFSKDDSIKAANCISINVKTSKFLYSPNDVNRFNDYVQLIDEYYKADNVIKENSEILARIKTDNIDMMPLFQVDLNNVKKSIEKIENQRFFTQLDLTKGDPIDFKNRFKLIKEKYATNSTIVNHLMSSIDEVYFNRGYSFYLKKNYEKASEYFERSIRSNPSYVRSHYRLAEVNFVNGQIDKSAEIILHVLKNLKIEKDIETNIIALAQQIMLEYIDRGDIKTGKEEFHQALKEFEKADLFCNSTSYLKCDSAIYRGIENARLGLYKSYLTIATKAIDGGEIELAAKFIYDAKRYLNEIGNLKINHKETDDIIGKVIDILVDKGRVQYDNKDYEASVNTYNKALDLCKLCKNTDCKMLIDNETKNAQTRLFENILVIIRTHLENENMESAENLLNEASKFQKENKVSYAAVYETENLWMMLDKIKYKQYISKGVDLLNNNKNTEALVYFMKAKAIEKEKVAFPDLNLDCYIQSAGKPLIMETLSEAKIKVWGNDIPAAKKLSVTIMQNISMYMLNEDSILVSQYNELVKRIKSQECSNFNFEIEKKYLSAKRLSDNSDYISAYCLLNELRDYLKNNNNCESDSIKIITSQIEIKDLYSYQNNKKLVIEAY
ncbi:MAG: tetratricopeptide repeat protein, partial [Methanomicrobium sp.]|nr:tetratricopeptide repeat protein [Methanomicrobium sp.]